MGLSRVVLAVGLSGLGLVMGCGVQQTKQQYAQPGVVSGAVHGGQQPVSGATIQLYAVGTGGDGSASMALLTKTVTTDANGGFNITGLYSCASATEVYITATGGDPSPGTANANLAMMTALGPCSSLGSGTFIVINELTTVAATSALATYMNSPIAVGSGTGDAAALAAAFTLSEELVDSATGASPGLGVPAGMSVPTTVINTLGDVAAGCVNSGGLAGSGTGCSSFFALTPSASSVTPADTITALLNLAKNPTMNTTGLYGLVPLQPPFVPTVGYPGPADFNPRLTPPASSMALQVTPGSLTFAAAQVGYSATPQDAYVQNISASAVAISGITITGANAGSFGETNNCGSSLASGAMCTVTVTETPAGTGALGAYLAVASGSGSSPQYVALSGSGEAATGVPQLVLSSYLVNVGNYNGLTTDVTLTNAGSGTLTIGSITTATGYYVVTNHCGASLAPQASCRVSVLNDERMGLMLNPVPTTPIAALSGDDQDALTVVTNDPAGPQVAMLRPSIAGGATYWFNPSNIDFPGTSLGSSATTTLVAPAFYSSTSPFTGPNAGDFSVVSVTDCGIIAFDGDFPCVVQVKFTPSGTGTRTAYYGSTSGGYVPIVGIGLATAPSTSITLTPSTLSFVDFAAAQPVTLTNYSSGTVNIQSVSVSAGFTETNNCGNLIYGQSICTITVASTQTLTGGVQGGLTVVDDLGTHTIPLASKVDQVVPFGGAVVGNLTPFYVSFNDGHGSLNFPQPSYTLTGSNPGSFPIQGGGYQPNEYFQPTALGLQTALLKFTDLGFDSNSAGYLLEGNGLGAGTAVTFGGQGILDAAVSSGTESTTLTVYNAGTTALNLSGGGAFGLSGANASEFSVASTTCGAVAAAGTCTVTIGFAPAQLGVRTATLSVTDATSGMVFTDALQGLGDYTAVSAAPGTLNFATTAANSTSAAVSTTVNSGGDPVTAVVTLNSADFSLTKSSCVKGETPCLITAVFHPVQGGALTGQLTVTDSTTGETTTVALSGTGTGIGYAVVSPTSVSFASRPSGSTSIPVTITLTNTGTYALGVSGASLSGMNAGEFLISSSTCSGSLTINGTCTVNVEFSPLTPGGKLAAVVISGDAGTDLPISVMVTGTAQ